MAGINWKTTGDEQRHIERIAERASQLGEEHGVRYPFMDAEMDVTACHLNGNPLDLEALASAPDADFGHDVFGIRRYIDHSTGKLTDCFVPRYTAPKAVSSC